MASNVITGNRTVDELYLFPITGNVTPATWFKTITQESGKADLIAISILSDLVYWFKPEELYDEATGGLVLRKKFSGNCLVKTYDGYEKLFNVSRDKIQTAFDNLETLGVIDRLFIDICENGIKIRNTMLIDLNIERLMELTYPPANADDDELEF